MAIGITNTITYIMALNGTLTAPASIDPIYQGSNGTVRIIIDSADYGSSSFAMQIKFRREQGQKLETKDMTLDGTDWYFDLTGSETLYAGALKISFNVYDAGGINLIVTSNEEDLTIKNTGVRVIETKSTQYTGLDTATAETNVDNVNDKISVNVLDSPKLGGEDASEYLMAGSIDIMKFNQVTEPTYEDGTLYYDNISKDLTFMTEEPDVRLNIGKELWADIYWNGVGTLLNGTVVTNTNQNITIAGKIYTIVEKADARFKERTSPIAVVTHDVETGTIGVATTIGSVKGIDTSAWIGLDSFKIYLGEEGAITPTRPIDGHFPVIVGHVIDASLDGIIDVNVSVSELTVDVTNNNGFPRDERFKTNILIDNGLLKFTLQHLSDYHFYQNGEKFEKTEDEFLTFTNTEGSHAVYFDDDVLTCVVNTTFEQFKDITLNKAWVSFFYWNVADQRTEYILDERHGLMPPETHLTLHQSIKTIYINGMGLTIPNIDVVNPTDDTAMEYSLTSGTIKDEDIEHNIIEKQITDNIREYAFVGIGTPEFTRTSETQYGASVTGTGRLAYNLLSGSTYSVEEPDDNTFIWRHVFSIPETDKTRPNSISMMGFDFYTDKNLADAGLSDELGTLIPLIPAPEFIHDYSILYQTKSSYANPLSSKIVSTSDGSIAMDFRTAGIGGAGAISSNSHTVLSERSVADQHPISAITGLDDALVRLEQLSGDVDLNTLILTGSYHIFGTVTDRPTDASAQGGFVNVWITDEISSSIKYIRQQWVDNFNDIKYERTGQLISPYNVATFPVTDGGWVAVASVTEEETATILVADWSGGLTATISGLDITTDDTVIWTPSTDTDRTNVIAADVRANPIISVDGEINFLATTTPTSDIDIIVKKVV